METIRCVCARFEEVEFYRVLGQRHLQYLQKQTTNKYPIWRYPRRVLLPLSMKLWVLIDYFYSSYRLSKKRKKKRKGKKKKKNGGCVSRKETKDNKFFFFFKVQNFLLFVSFRFVSFYFFFFFCSFSQKTVRLVTVVVSDQSNRCEHFSRVRNLKVSLSYSPTFITRKREITTNGLSLLQQNGLQHIVREYSGETEGQTWFTFYW